MSKPLLIIGAGGHASVLVDILRQQKRKILGLVSPRIDSNNKVFRGIEHFENDDDILKFDKNTIKLVNGIGTLPGKNLRTLIYKNFLSLGYEFETVIDSTAIVSIFANLEDGVHVFAGSIIQTGASIGENTIINTGAIIEHDCFIGKNNHIAPSVTLSGQVNTAANVHIGTGATVIQSISIGENSIVGAGAIVTSNIIENEICFPARIIKKAIL